MLRTALTAVCGFTMLATAYLSLSLFVLRPPRASYQHWAFEAAAIVAAGMLTLMALVAARSAALRYTVLAAGAGLAVLGAMSINSTLSGPHFEGYALVLGAALVAQGALTWIAIGSER
jgi:hypothetical protein